MGSVVWFVTGVMIGAIAMKILMFMAWNARTKPQEEDDGE